VVVKKGSKGKEQAKVGTSQISSSLAETNRKESQHTQPIESATTVKKKRKKETVPRSSVLGTDNAERTNGEAHKKDTIPSQEKPM
jgi:hypothetical protein